MSHTPGPWTVHDWDNHLHVEALGRDEVCLVTNRYHDDTTEANAHLISAAPDLLEALDELAKIVELNYDDMKPGIVTYLRYCIETLAIPAIAKARGEEE